MPDIVNDTRAQIEKRLTELRGVVEEHDRLQRALDALDAIPTAASGGGEHGPGRARATPGSPKARRGKARRSGRRKGSGGRAAESLATIQAQPGITIPEIAAKLGIKHNYLYRVLPALQKEKKIRKSGKGWHPVG